MSIDILSAIYGNYETPKPATPQTIDVSRWLMVTDNPDLEAPGWEVIYEPRPHVHPNVAAKVPKYRPDYYSDADYTIWIDSSATIKPMLAEVVWDSLQRAPYGITQYRHPDRDCMVSEAMFSMQLPKYDGLPLSSQASTNLARGMPLNWGLWATGLIGRDHEPDNRCYLERFGDLWMYETVRWGFQDQISHPYAAWATGLRITDLPGNLRDGQLVHWGQHAKAGM